MIRIKKLYTDPPQTTPIEFEPGINIILGEKDETSRKTNGVGKSLCIEFINFALMKSRAESRVTKIPCGVLKQDTLVCLEFDINGIAYTSRRAVYGSESPIISTSGFSNTFTKVEDAASFLTERMFSSHGSIRYPSFRTMMGPLIRDERSEFKSIIQCYDTRRRIPENYEPHLYLFGIDLEAYESVRSSIKRLEEISQDSKRVKENVKLLRGTEIKDARSVLNELEREVAQIQASLDGLENISGYNVVKDELIIIEDRIDRLRRERAVALHQLRRLKPIQKLAQVDASEVEELYSTISRRLGDIVRRDLTEVLDFKRRIDEYQNRLVGERRIAISERLAKIDSEAATHDDKYRHLLSALDQRGQLKNLKQTYAAHKERSDELAQLKSFVSRFERLEDEKQRVRSRKESEVLNLQVALSKQREVIHEFEEFLLDMHEFIQGNRRASFDINLTSRKQVVDFDLRIDDDGSHSIEREKVFMYDIALLLSNVTQGRHPGLLIHDNIFGVDDDTLAKSLCFLYERARFGSGHQYIITINSDQIEHLGAQGRLAKDLAEAVRASFTKKKRFLAVHYQEGR